MSDDPVKVAQETAKRFGFRIQTNPTNPEVASLICNHCHEIEGGGYLSFVIVMAVNLTRACKCRRASA